MTAIKSSTPVGPSQRHASVARRRVIVVTDVFGQAGGAGRVASLTCQTLSRMGVGVTCFATWVEPSLAIAGESFRIVQPAIRRGSRWDLPNRVLAIQARREILRTSPDAVISVGLTRLCGLLLSSSGADQVQVWELTNANPGNKFVDPEALRWLNRAKAVLSPAGVIDTAVRSTYGWSGLIKRLPFWIEDVCSQYSDPPATFTSDFLLLARREDDKGLRELIRATAIVANQFPDVRVQIGGPGSATAYQSLAEELGVTRQTEFVDLPLRADAMRSLAGTRWLVLPSYHEGYPLSLLEAARCSIPFIATTVGAVPEVFDASTACKLIPPRDAQSLAQAMTACLNESATEYLSRRRAAYRRFTELSSESTVERTLREVILEDQHLDCTAVCQTR